VDVRTGEGVGGWWKDGWIGRKEVERKICGWMVYWFLRSDILTSAIMNICVAWDELHYRFVNKYKRFYPGEGRIRFFPKFGKCHPDYMMSQPRRQSALL
jgi:hypothetical protein